MSPLLKLLSSAVAVCVVLSLFFQVTVVPAVTVKLVGEKLMLCMVIVLAAVPVLLLLLFPDEEEPYELPLLQLLAMATDSTKTISTGRKYGFFIINCLALLRTKKDKSCPAYGKKKRGDWFKL